MQPLYDSICYNINILITHCGGEFNKKTTKHLRLVVFFILPLWLWADSCNGVVYGCTTIRKTVILRIVQPV